MFEISASYRDLGVVAFFLGLFAIPLVTATILSWRSHRRRWWLAAPALLFLTLTPAIIFALGSTGQFKGNADAPLLVLAIPLGAWASLSVFLVALAVAGPKPPKLDIEEVF